MVIRRNPETGRRQILIDGVVFPTFTHGDIDIEPIVRWTGEEGTGDPIIIGYDVGVTCFVPNIIVEDPAVLAEIRLADEP